MARGPFQGTFQPNARPTVAMAPDALVYFNGEAEVVGCPQCSRRFDFNKYITSITTNLSVDGAPGSASVSLAVPRHSIDDFYFDGNPVLTVMMEVEIFAKGYYLVEGMPQYYPIFWGLVTEVSDNYSSGEHTVSVECAGILKWWELCKMNINAAYTAPAGQLGPTIVGNAFVQFNPYDIIWTLASQSFGDVMVGTGSYRALIREATQLDRFNASVADMMLYWERRFQRMRSNLLLYGTNGTIVRGDTIWQKYSKAKTASENQGIASTAIREACGGEDGAQYIFDAAAPEIATYKWVASNIGLNFMQSEYQTKLELANAAKETIGYEFFMDVTGDLVFKPPFYNVDVLGNAPTSWIQDIDIIDWGFSESESEVITHIVMQGSASGTKDYGADGDGKLTPFTTVTDYHLVRKYGWRSQTYNSEFMASPEQLFFHGLDMLDRINSKRNQCTITIPMRPELRLGFPVYVVPKDQIWYVNGISHQFQFGGRCTTSLQLTAKRSKFIAPRGIGDLHLKDFSGSAEPNKDGTPRPYPYSARRLAVSGTFELRVGDALRMPADQSKMSGKAGAENPAEPLILRHPKTGRIVGYPNVVLAYTRPFATSDIANYAGQKSSQVANPNVATQVQQVIDERRKALDFQITDRFTANKDSVLQGKYLNNTYQFGLNSAGEFIYAHDSSLKGAGVISEMVPLPIDNLHVVDNVELQQQFADRRLSNPTALIRPISDERGFELVGHYQYGRRVRLKDGRLIIDDPNGGARVALQLALAGDLSGALTAQSQGLTTVTTGYGDPAEALATMIADEQAQTQQLAAAQATPNVKGPEYTDVGTVNTEVSTATLGSQEVHGTLPSVEATQLSRALTLAEMSVQDELGRQETDCVCLTGRADLAFMSQDYQVSLLSGKATADSSTLAARISGEPLGATEAAARQVAFLTAERAALEKRMEEAREEALAANAAAEASLTSTDESLAVTQAATQKVLDLESAWFKVDADLKEAQKKLDEQRAQYHSSGSILTLSNQETVTRVNQFLVSLYKTLDDAHQQFESAIRGDLFPQRNAAAFALSGPTTRGGRLNVGATGTPSEFAPPFSAPNRFASGDPTAAVGAVQTNAANIAKAWSDFGQNLRSNSEERSLSTQISQDKASIARLTATRDQLIKQRDSSTKVIGFDVQKQINTMTQEITRLQQEVERNQAKLNAK